jgi:nitrogen fixation/metabolism regulation signal transduction histidine kinase
VEKTQRDLTRFLEAVEHEDFAQTFSGKGLGRSFAALTSAYNAVLDKFRETRAEKEEHFRYLQTIVQHVGIGLVSFQMNGDVDLINAAAKRLLGVPYLKNIRSLSEKHPDLVKVLQAIRPGDRMLVKVNEEQETLHYVVQATAFVMRERHYTLVSLQNIQSELDEREMEAWQRLIRTLTHEIMNSITPIASLASTSHQILSSPPFTGDPDTAYDREALDDLRNAVHTIEKRSKGLLHFVESYRKLTRIPKPTFQVFPVEAVFNRVHRLMRGKCVDHNIAFALSVEPQTLEVTADPELIEQVIINLLLNAIEALDGKSSAMIQLRGFLDARDRVVLQVIDNGPGILPEAQEKIFIPFFTTKKSGSGIGLSLSHQIMRLHRGSLSVSSAPNERTTFTMRF